MRPFLARRWFLLALVGGVGLACFSPAWLQPVTRLLEPRAVVAPALFLMAWTLESRSLFGALARPLPALWAVLISYVAVPACGWLAGYLLPDADLRIGLMIMVSVPCTLASAVLWTRMAGGNEATALLVTLLTTCTSWFATTAWLVASTGLAVRLDPLAMMRDLALVLVLPVGMGQLLRAFRPMTRLVTEHKPILGFFSQLLILGIILRAAVDVSLGVRPRVVEVAIGSFLLAAVLCVGTHLAALAVGLWSSRAFGFDRPSRIAVAFACSQKTLPVALLLFDTHYKEAYPLAVVPVFLYHVGQLVVDTFIADGLANRKQRAEVEAPPAKLARTASKGKDTAC
jgi:sodium/bile acid cotransporter 7